MSSRAFFVVGEKFNQFATGKEVLTIDQLKSLTRLPRRLLGGHHVLKLGQGVNRDDLLTILRSVEANPELGSCFNVADLHRVHDRASSRVSHKQVPHNIVIGSPRRTGLNTFDIALNLDERCELMGDHQTGQHLQGMLIVEAFRQSFLVVTDTFFPFGQGATYFVINAMQVEFQNFLFPLPSHIAYRIIESDVTDRRARYKATMSLLQNGRQCSSAIISFTVYPAKEIADREAQLAELTTELMLDSRHEPRDTAAVASADTPEETEEQSAA